MGRKAKKEDNPKAQLATKRKMQKRGQNTVYYLLFAALCLAIGIVMSFTVFFRIDLIKVSSNEATSRYEDDDIIITSGIMLGDNLFRLDSKEIKKRLLKAYPYIEDVSFRRMLPSIMEINLTISEPFAAVDIGEWNLVVDKQGRVLDQISKSDPNSPTYRRAEGFKEEPYEEDKQSWYRNYTCLGGIQHIGLQDMEKGELDSGVCKAGYRHTDKVSRKQLSPYNMEKLQILMSLEEIFQKYDMQNITAVQLTDPNNLYLLYDNRLLISLGNINELDYKLQFADYTIDNSVEKGFTGMLDVSVPKYARLRGVNIFTDEYWQFSPEFRTDIIGNIMDEQPENTDEEGSSEEVANEG